MTEIIAIAKVLWAFIVGHGTAAAIGAGATVILMFAGKKIPAMVGSIFAKKLNLGFSKVEEIQDPIKKGLYMTLALDVVKLVEYEIPDKGKGKERYNIASAKLCSLIPWLKGQEALISDLIENAVVAMDNELKKKNPAP